MTNGTWSIRHDVREDAPSVFVPADELPGAAVGDTVEVTSTSPGPVRTGRVADIVDDAQRGRHVVVSFEPPNEDVVVEREAD